LLLEYHFARKTSSNSLTVIIIHYGENKNFVVINGPRQAGAQIDKKGGSLVSVDRLLPMDSSFDNKHKHTNESTVTDVCVNLSGGKDTGCILASLFIVLSTLTLEKS